MHRFTNFVWLGVFCAVVAGSFAFRLSLAQEPPPTGRKDLPGGLRLLEGYKHEQLRGTDSDVGRITKGGGITIQYDIGRLAGNYAERVPEDERAWARTQKVGERELLVVMKKDHRLYATYAPTKAGDPPANFYGTAESPLDVADFLLTVITFPESAAHAQPAPAS